MSTEQQQVGLPSLDPANPFTPTMGPQPATVSAEVVRAPLGVFLRVCFRTPDTSLVIVLSKEDAAAWGMFLRQQADSMSGLIIPAGMPANGVVPGTVL